MARAPKRSRRNARRTTRSKAFRCRARRRHSSAITRPSRRFSTPIAQGACITPGFSPASEGSARRRSPSGFARFLFAHPDPASQEVAAANDLSVPPDHPAARRVALGAHGNLLHLQREWNEKRNRYRTELRVQTVRRIIPFLGTHGERRGMARGDRRSRRRHEPERRERHPEEPGGAAAADVVPAPRGTPRRAASDHPVALAHAQPRSTVGRGDRGGGAGVAPGALRDADDVSSRRRLPPEARAGSSS